MRSNKRRHSDGLWHYDTEKPPAFLNRANLMAQDGLLKALKGITTVDEVFRVAQ
jgi:type II secretory ATPase GspE/PulE/Tfp pilus assembly ATPase PilB-like protein